MKVAIVGCGPRGILTIADLTRFFARSNIQHLDLQVCDPSYIGGRIWRTTQDPSLKMNLPAKQIQFISIPNIPNLYQWIKGPATSFIRKVASFSSDRFLTIINNLKANDAAPRCIFGIYLQWIFHQIITHLPQGCHLKYYSERVDNVIKDHTNYRLIFQNQHSILVNKVIFNLGSLPRNLTNNGKALQQYAHKHSSLCYLPSDDINQKKLQKINPRQKVIIRGLGSKFIDLINLLTSGRGGIFHQHTNQLIYRASGKEPHIIAGSRRGVPYYCRENLSSRLVRHHFRFLTSSNIKIHLKNGKLKYSTFIQLLHLEIEFIYYTRLIKLYYPHYQVNQFQHRFLNTKHPYQIIKDYRFKPKDQLNWQKVLNPVAGLKITTLANYEKAVLKWLKNITNGKQSKTLLPSLQIIPKTQNLIRVLSSHHRLSNTNKFKLLTAFNNISRFLSCGPTVNELRRLSALIRAHVITILGPHMNAVGAGGHFICNSTFYPRRLFQANVLLEAHQPQQQLSQIKNPLIQNLLKAGILSQPSFSLTNGQQVSLRVINVNLNHQLITANNKTESDLYSWGPCTKSIYWRTDILPGINYHNVTAQQITKQILKLN